MTEEGKDNDIVPRVGADLSHFCPFFVKWRLCREQWDGSLNGGARNMNGYCYFCQVAVARGHR